VQRIRLLERQPARDLRAIARIPRAPPVASISQQILYRGSAAQGKNTGRSHIMRQIPFVVGPSVAFLLLSAAIAANIGGNMPEMRGAWIAQALR